MQIDPFISEDGEYGRRERVDYDYTFGLDAEGGVVLAFIRPPDGDTLSCLQGVPIFGLRLRPGTSRAQAETLAEMLRWLGVGWEAVYGPPDHGPTFPSSEDGKVVSFPRAAA